jgi:hypothetical protein
VPLHGEAHPVPRTEEARMPEAGSATWRLGRRTMRVSHLDKLYWRDDGLTKGDLLGSDPTIAPAMLP